jgi:hypothetical protein
MYYFALFFYFILWGCQLMLLEMCERIVSEQLTVNTVWGSDISIVKEHSQNSLGETEGK